MRVYKYCEPKYNPLKGCATIMLGSTNIFRKSYAGEGDLIGDVEEQLLAGRDERGNFFKHTQLIPDCLIFCASTDILQPDEVKQQFGEKYTDCYSIKDFGAFKSALTELLHQQIQINHFRLVDQKGIKKDINIPEVGDFETWKKNLLGIHSLANCVQYIKGKMIALGDLAARGDCLYYSCFHKPEKYIGQKEIRAAFIPFHLPSDYDFQMEQNILVQFGNIKEYVEEC